jgi:hypothetical protein
MARDSNKIDRLMAILRELQSINPGPSSIETAWQGISDAIERAESTQIGKKWMIPGLDHEFVSTCRDGSVKIPLIAHRIYINSTGAFRIVDLWEETSSFFEVNSAQGASFVMPL